MFLIYVHDIPQALKSNLFLYASDICLMYQYRSVEEISDWFVEDKLSKHFGEDKAKSILSPSKRKIKSARKLNIMKYKDIKIK